MVFTNYSYAYVVFSQVLVWFAYFKMWLFCLFISKLWESLILLENQKEKQTNKQKIRKWKRYIIERYFGRISD